MKNRKIIEHNDVIKDQSILNRKFLFLRPNIFLNDSDLIFIYKIKEYNISYGKQYIFYYYSLKNKKYDVFLSIAMATFLESNNVIIF